MFTFKERNKKYRNKKMKSHLQWVGAQAGGFHVRLEVHGFVRLEPHYQLVAGHGLPVENL